MPLIHLETLSGLGTFHYTISTPTEDDATTVTPGLPTLVLVHGMYTTSIIFHPMFADVHLRRFNLVTMDLRGFGPTTATIEDTYGRAAAAQDFLGLMKALNLPPCHVMGVSVGSSIALEMAILAPEQILSLFMLSPLPLVEPQDANDGRQEIYDIWVQAYENPDAFDESAIADSLAGTLQLTYNSDTELPFVKAATAFIMRYGQCHWVKSRLDECYTAGVKFFMDPPPTAESLARIRCPVALVHCGADMAYPIAYTEERRDLLQTAGVDAKISVIEGAPHAGNATHPKETNTMLCEFVLANSPGLDIPPPRASVKSPFLEALLECGLKADEDEDGDDDSDDEPLVVRKLEKCGPEDKGVEVEVEVKVERNLHVLQ
ncbi:Alpha/Beta hydrolase protein [Mycena crocata]|nr:Alpha/Beta hydrolase protein [Mycena crocata]